MPNDTKKLWITAIVYICIKNPPWINVQDTGLSLPNSLKVIAYSDCDKGGGGSSICTKIVVKIVKCLKKRR